MATKRLDMQDSFLQRCETVVTGCVPDGKGAWWVCLAETPFFPEGGGQPSDRGTIGQVAVIQVKEQGEEVLHRTTAPLEVGSRVEAQVDFARRMDMMQQHTGEHILAAAAFELFGANNVGFHLSETTLMVDFDRPLAPEELGELEHTANRWVWENHPIAARIISREEYEAIPMRKKAEHITGEIRLVEIAGVDCATCCGTHCTASGQVGMIKILTSESYKGGTRVEFACGGRALADYAKKNQMVNRLAVRYSVKPDLVGGAVDKLEGEMANLRQQLAARTSQLIGHIARQLLEEEKADAPFRLIATVQKGLLPGDAKELLGLLTSGKNRVAAVLIPQGERLFYFFGCGKGTELSMQALCAKAGELLGGKGGGGPVQAQGSAPLSPGWEEYWNRLAVWAQGELEESSCKEGAV